MNTNSSGIAFQNLPTQVISSGSETQLLYTGASSPALANGANLVLNVDTGTNTLDIFDGHPFYVRLVGRAAMPGTTTVNIKLYFSTAGALTTNIAATGASNSTTLTNFYEEIYCVWDSVTQKLNGQQISSAGTTVVAATALAAVVTPATQNLLSFTASATFGGANAGNSVTVSEFSIERS